MTWAVLDISEGGNYGRIRSVHDTKAAALAALDGAAERDLGERPEDRYRLSSGRPAATQSAISDLMWDVGEVDGDVGDRVRYRP